MANKTILQYPNKKQFMITVPKGLVLAKGWKRGDKLEFVLNNKGEIIIRKVKNE
ncbi:AbrB/MazE/SpoVT family DNA-binding domain-containing protein [Candidatus Woesearchaeota archaeon]|nr:AbrB/MazE/SpoVT family DNA-binding domain-containing protein [Candidatus Woesearchaeota archaeon]